MILKDLLDEVEFEDVFVELKKLYYDDESEEELLDIYDNYEKTFNALRNKQPSFDGENFIIKIDKTFEWGHDDKNNYVETEEFYWNVHGINRDTNQSYGIEFSSWDKWLGWDVDRSQVKNIGENIYVAHILWEMTYMGFEEDEIQEIVSGLKSMVDEAKDSLSEPFEFRDETDEIFGENDLDDDSILDGDFNDEGNWIEMNEDAKRDFLKFKSINDMIQRQMRQNDEGHIGDESLTSEDLEMEDDDED